MLNFIQKLSNWLYHKRIPLLPKLFRIIIFILFHCDIPPTVKIGNNVVFAHQGLGVVINGNCQIGDGTRISPNVVIGGAGKERLVNGNLMVAPCIGKNVIIGAGSQVIGPIFIADGAVIGAGSVVTKDVPAYTTVAGNPSKNIH